MSNYQKPWTDAGGCLHDPANAPSQKRIVSLVPSLTETLCAVGGRSRIMGVTQYCIFPDDLLRDPTLTLIGGTKNPQREKILALKPDLLLLNLEENRIDDIEFFKSRVKCYVNGVCTLDEGIATIEELAALIEEPNAPVAHPITHTLAQQAREILSSIRQRVLERKAAGGATPRIFYPIWREPWMSINGQTFINDQLKTCGVDNIFEHLQGTRYPVVTLEQVAQSQPDIVWLPSEPYKFGAEHIPEFSRFPRVELVNGDNVCWFGVRQIEGMEYTFQRLWKQCHTQSPLPVR